MTLHYPNLLRRAYEKDPDFDPDGFLAAHKHKMHVLQVGVAVFVALLLLCSTVKAHSRFAPAPLPYSCATVKTAVAAMTREHLEKLAKEMGIVVTPSQRREVAKCLARG